MNVIEQLKYCIIFGVALLGLGTTSVSASNLLITDPIFSTGYSYHTREIANRISGTPISEINRRDLFGRTLWFSFAIIGGPETYRQIEEKNGVGIFVNVLCNGQSTDHRIPVGMDQEDWVEDQDALQSEIDQEGVFHWRTVARKQNTECSEMQFRVYDERSGIIGPPGAAASYVRTLIITD